MKTRHHFLKTFFALAAAAALPCLPFTAQADGTHFKLPGFEHLEAPATSAAQPGKTRAQVRMELEEYRRLPLSADGWLQVGNEQMYVGAPQRPDATHVHVRADPAGWSGPVNEDLVSPAAAPDTASRVASEGR